ncbi:ADP-ribosylglycohydrolase family protein [Peribacillus muralis]|uniref:ADP-ribosylglycohydrolase family protein n=1 Tax=Peribacillus muralis TaxID=264697 RepID=UPI001F4E4189|nr:ADP-ribosylglycohydrolase family protein [Peribacillus muralis]MCK1993288.1 ADP-ribosylglycohydrolase family protein [Peribacillus muralis]MCK2013842.1 ADP-ribosylglycohydrolase family protein [Peribacillus muralis]
MIDENYVKKVYAGFLGMNVGIRLGAPLEPVAWTYERIEKVFGDINGYVKDYKNFAADDDANGPIFFLRALYDYAHDRELQAEDVGKVWLDYSREGIGMFWWGGEGISTEHTAFLNLKKGIMPPMSGSIEQNGLILAEQIGGQIFIDTWGLIFPNQIEKAAEYAEKAASVSHDGNGIYGARFMAACIAKAFSADSIEEIIQAGLSVIPEGSTYSSVVKAVHNFHQGNPKDYRACRQYLEENWGYDKYTGVCHIIPNAGVCVLALLYGNGDFSRTIEIATMCSWDTDCNAGNVGTIMGLYHGLEGIKPHYRGPINDAIVASSVSGYLNIVDIPTFSKEVAILGYKMAKVSPPKELVKSVKHGELYFDFEMSGATHGFRTSNSFKTLLRSNDDFGYKSKGSLEIVVERMVKTDQSKVFYKPFYRRDDFNDEKYKPTFAPQVSSGQKCVFKLFLDQWEGEKIRITPYVRDTFTKKDLKGLECVLQSGSWNDIEFTVPDLQGSSADEIGFIVETDSPLSNRAIGRLFLDEFHVYGPSSYEIDFAKQKIEFLSVTPFSHNRGEWSLDGNYMRSKSDEGCSSYSGNYYRKDVRVSATVKPIHGTSHTLLFRSQGVQRSYFAGFDGKDTVSLIINNFGYERIASIPFLWQLDKEYLFTVEAQQDDLRFFINGELVLHHNDSTFNSGMFGYASVTAGECLMKDFMIEEIPSKEKLERIYSSDMDADRKTVSETTRSEKSLFNERSII